MATTNPMQSQVQKNFQNQLNSLQGGKISNPQITKVNNQKGDSQPLKPAQTTLSNFKDYVVDQFSQLGKTQTTSQPKNLNTTFQTDKTIGGNNYYIPNGGQGQQNALVNTGAVAGIKEQGLPTLEQPQKDINKGQVLKAREQFKKGGTEYYCPVPTPQNPDPQPVPVKKTTATPQQQPEPTPQPEQPIEEQPVEQPQVEEPQVEEQPQEQVQEEEREKPEMNIEGDNKEGVIYGRASGNNDTRIETDADPYSAEAMAMQGRQQNYTNLQGMNSMDIATSIVNGFDPYGSQAMRDLQQYDPQKYEEIQSYIKQLNGEQQVNNITSGGTVNLTDSLKKQADTINNGIDDRAKKNSDGPSYNSTKDMLTDKLASSQTAQTATQEMININTQIADIQERMQNLPNEAKKVFKGDVPQYLVDAYVSNNMQRLQSELGTLQNRYSGLIDMYKTEVAQKQWETEMELKNRQFQADQLRKQYDYNLQNQKLAFDQQKRGQQYALDLQQFQLSTIKTDSNGRPYQINGDGTMTYIQDTTAQMLINQQRQNAVNSLLSTKPDGAWGGQCEAFTNRYLESTYGTRFQGVNGYTTAEEKAGYINTDEPVIGSIAIFNYDKNSGVSEDAKKYGHTMVVTGYDPSTGTITLKGSNKSNKAGEKEMVYTSTYNIKNLKTGSLKGFYDPMLDKSLDDQVIAGDNSTGYNITEMTPVRDKLFQSASTEGKSDTIATAESIYTSLKKIRDDGSLYDLITSGAMGKIIGQLQGKKFVSDDDGGMFAQELTKIIGNTGLGLSEKSKIALLELRGLVEQKLRKETGAAIASSEWLSNFAQLVPEANESEDMQMSKLKRWDDIIFKYARKGGMASDEYIPLFQGDLPTGLESELEAIINDNRTGTGGKRFDPSYRF